MSGSELITAERERQIDAFDWTPEHDDGHIGCELLDAAICYAGMARSQILDSDEGAEAQIGLMEGWPFEPEWWKPNSNPVRNLVKAGAFIAAEIDRLQRASSGR